MKTLSICCEESFAEKVENAAKKDDRTVSSLVRVAVNGYLKQKGDPDATQ